MKKFLLSLNNIFLIIYAIKISLLFTFDKFGTHKTKFIGLIFMSSVIHSKKD